MKNRWVQILLITFESYGVLVLFGMARNRLYNKGCVRYSLTVHHFVQRGGFPGGGYTPSLKAYMKKRSSNHDIDVLQNHSYRGLASYMSGHEKTMRNNFMLTASNCDVPEVW